MIEKAILKINPTAEFSVNADDINQITWLNGTTPIAKELILEKLIEVKDEAKFNEYKRHREKNYPSLYDQLDMIYWDKINGTNNWQDAINAVKAKYPKGE